MAKCITVDEMLDIARQLDPVYAAQQIRIIEAFGTSLAEWIAEKAGVEASEAKNEEAELGGTAATFGPLNPGDPEPECFKYFDQGQDWEEGEDS